MNRTVVSVLLTSALILAACTDEEIDTDTGAVVVIDDDVAADDDGAVADPVEDDPGEDDPGDGGPGDGGPGDLSALGGAVFSETECPFDIEVEIDVDCGIVEVPESRQGLSDATIEIAIAILRTPAPDPAPDPVVFLAGGPGGVALAEHAGFLPDASIWEFDAFLSTRDLILVDQRGVGFSRPSLACDDQDPADCYERLLAEGVTVAAYSTPENAADIAAIRMALGYDEWNIYGSSYGTRLGLVVMRDHPQGVRSAVLAGVYPPDKVPAYHDYIGNALRAIEAMADECRRQAACDAAYGDLQELLVVALNETQSGPSAYTAQDLFDAMFQAMYSMPSLAVVPRALWLAANGEADGAMEVLTGDDAGLRGRAPLRTPSSPAADSDGFFNSVECREEQGFTSIEVLEAQAEEYLQAGFDEMLVAVLFDGAVANTESVCAFWDSGLAPDVERRPAVSDIPTLLLSGEFDPITPPSWGDLAAASLSRGSHVVVPSLSHSLLNIDQCIDDLVIDFLRDPTAPLDTRCVPSMETVPFELP